MANPSKFAVGRYRFDIAGSCPIGKTFFDDAEVKPQVEGPYKVAGKFISETTVEIQIHALTTGALADPTNGLELHVSIYL